MTALLLPPVITDATRREFLALLAAAGLLTGCAADDPASPGAGRRVIGHLEGETVLDGIPSRVVVADATAVLDVLLALGVVPVATGVYDSYGGAGAPVRDPWTAEALRALGAPGPEVVSANAPSVERIAALAPDLIIRSADEVQSWAGLDGVAPVVVVDFARVPQLRLLAEVFDRRERADELEVERAAALASVQPPPGLGLTVVSPTTTGAFAYQPGQEGMATLLADAGLPLTDRGLPPEEFGVEIADENLLDLDDDRLWVIDPQVGEFSLADRLEASPLWSRIPAVAEGRARRLTPVESRALLFGTPLAIPTVVDTLRRLTR